MLRIGILGCGRIADQHATEIQKIPGCEIVGVCDREILMARQMHERFNIKSYFSDLSQLLELEPDIVHITTPPHSHFQLASLCLEAGCHVFIEKPFTLNATQAEKLIKTATRHHLKLTVGHNAYFSYAAIRMRKLIQNGYLGGPPVHMESIWCYPFTDPTYAKAILGDPNHWIRSLPGRYLHDIISHGISPIVEFLQDDSPTVIAHAFVSPFMKNINENDIIDELRVIITDNHRTTAYFTFSSQMAPPIKQFRIYGSTNSLIYDKEHETLIKVSNNYKYYLNHFLSPLADAKQYFVNAVTNLKGLLKHKYHFESGRKFLIESFYLSVLDGTPLPIPYREILLTSRVMDNIFKQIY